MTQPADIRFDDSPKPAFRRDAQERRRRIVDVAVELYRTESTDFSMDRLAAEAEVGRATLYRFFPDRTALLIAVLERHLELFAAFLKKSEGRDDAFMLGIRYLADRATASRGFGQVAKLDEQSPGVAVWATDMMQRLLSEPLDRAKDAKLIRKDFPISDHGLLVLMIAGVERGSRQGDAPQRTEKAVKLLARALRP